MLEVVAQKEMEDYVESSNYKLENYTIIDTVTGAVEATIVQRV
jgi:hypothetical protein